MDGGLPCEFKSRLEPLGWHCQRIETGGTGRGIPDTNYAAPGGIEGWIEFKQATGFVVTLRAEQCGWLQRRARLGGRVWIAVRQRAGEGLRRELRDGLWLCQGKWAGVLAEQGLRWASEQLNDPAMGVYHWPGPGPRRWGWDEVRALLSS